MFNFLYRKTFVLRCTKNRFSAALMCDAACSVTTRPRLCGRERSSGPQSNSIASLQSRHCSTAGRKSRVEETGPVGVAASEAVSH